MANRTLILPIGAGVIGQDDVPLVRIMDSDETPTTITVYGVVDTVQPVTGVTWTVNGVEQTGDVSRSPVLELTNLQPETSYAITLRATNINGESSASARTITTKKITTVTPNAVLDGVSYYNLDVYYTGNIPTKDETDIVINGRDVTVPTGYYAESETVSVSSDYIIPTGTKNITDNGNEDVTQYANVNVNVQPALYTPSNVTPTTSQQTISAPTGYYGLDSVTVDGVTSAIDANIQAGNIKDGVTILGVTGTFDPTPNLDTLNVTPSTSFQTITPTGGADGFDEVNVSAVTSSIDQNIVAGNIKSGVTILGVTGSYNPEPVLEPVSVTPSTSGQLILPTSGSDGYNSIVVNPVTSSIDNNITASNIKKDVTILGVTGTFEGGITPTGTLKIVNNGTYDITNYANVNVNVAAGDFNELCFTANEANCTVSMWQGATNRTIYYSTDNKATWTLWDYSVITLANINDKVYFYGYNPTEFTASGDYNSSSYKGFVTTGNLKVSGNIMTLISRYGDRENTVGSNTFYRLFLNTTITDASDLVLPATTLSTNCYSQMFYGCGNLVNGPVTLPSLNLAEYCYSSMFKNCSSLTTAPELPATNLAKSCYYNMFNGCTSLVTAPSVLPATTLTDNCYYQMFRQCSSLITAPELPATNLASYCYSSMFQNCTGLVTAPELPAIILVNNCYNSMFQGCTNLNSITVHAQTWNSSNTSNWVNNVAASGTFIKPVSLTIGTGTGQIPADSANGIPTGWTVAEMPSVTDDNEYITINVPTGQTAYYTTDGTNPTTASTQYTAPIDAHSIGDIVTVKCISTDGNNYISPVVSYTYINMFYIEALENNTVLNLQNWSQSSIYSGQKCYYSTDKINWTVIPRNTSSYSLPNAGDKIYIKRFTQATSTDTGNVWGQGSLNAVTSGTIKVGGCLEYACYWDITGNRAANTGCENMFQNCTGLVDASKLKLFGSYYKNMFNGCTGLTAVPELPSTTLVNESYRSMFQGCTSLVTAPSLPTTTLTDFCYESMFKGCTSLVNPPSELPALSVDRIQSCYSNMFNGCTSLTESPKIKVSTLYTTYTTSPLYNMFNGCTSLVRVEIDATVWNGNQASSWLNGVAANGTLIKSPSLVVGTGTGQIPTNATNGIPSGWVPVNKKETEHAFDVRIIGSNVFVILQNEWPAGSYKLCDIIATHNDSPIGANGYIEVYVNNGVVDYDDSNWNNTTDVQFYANLSYTYDNGRQMFLDIDTSAGYYIDFDLDSMLDDCSDWQEKGYIDYNDCECSNFEIHCPDCTDCNNWEKCGYTTYQDCMCSQYGEECPEEPDPCQECINGCNGDPDCEASCYDCEAPCNPDEPCTDEPEEEPEP